MKAFSHGLKSGISPSRSPLDGNEAVHNKNRILTDFQAHNKAVTGIRKITEELGAKPVAIVTKRS